MNGKDIFLGLKYVGDDLIEKAEYGQFPTKAEHTATQKKRMSIRRPFLIAAIIAMMLLLVGCAVIYVLSLQEIKLGDQTVTYDISKYDPVTGEISEGQESVHQQVLTLAGLSNTPAAKAAREWYEFTDSYDPDLEIKKSVWGNIPDFGDKYYGYDLYTQEMKDKLDEILDKYDLKLRGKLIEFETPKRMLQAMDIESLLNPDTGAKLDIEFPYRYYENGVMYLNALLTLPGENGDETVRVFLNYLPKDCFIPDTAVLTEAQWEESNYTTAGGDDVLILRAEDSSSAWLLCDTGSSTTSISVDVLRDMSEEVIDGVPVVQYEMMPKELLERLADAIDFSLQPRLVDGWEDLSYESIGLGETYEGYRFDLVSTFTDGYAYEIVLYLTAPEGVTLTDPEDHTVRVKAGNGDSGYCVEDGDGRLNTCHFILSGYVPEYELPVDGSLPFPKEHVISVYMEDLYSSYFDFDNIQDVDTLLAEGTWEFDVKLSEADTREIELLTEPIVAKACVGFMMDGTDVFEDRKITSIKLRSMGMELTTEESDADFLSWTGVKSHLVMKNGTQVDIGWNHFDRPIDLDQVAYLQLADNTIIPMPGVDDETVNAISAAMPVAVEDLPVPTFDEGIELLMKPITLKHLSGWATDATGDADPLYEYFTFSSVILHPQGLAMVGSHAFDFPEEQATVVMKDGSEIILTGMNGAPYCSVSMSQLKAESIIDLTNADHLILPDGTKLTIPQ